MNILVLVLALLLALLIVWFVVKTVVALALLLMLVLVASLVAQSFLHYRGGLTFTLVSGLIGGVVGLLLARLLGMPELLKIGGLPVLWTFIGSLIVVAAAKLVEPGRRRA